MQIGEPVAVVPVATPPPDVELEAELVSITFRSGIKVSYRRRLVEGASASARVAVEKTLV